MNPTPNISFAINISMAPFSPGTTRYMVASKAVPPNNIRIITASMVKTAFAYLVGGSLKFGTALLTASIPVKAVQPLEKALSNRISVKGSTTPLIVGTGGIYPVCNLISPAIIIVKIPNMNA